MATVPEPRVVKPDHNALGKAAFILGLLALILSFIPIIGFVAWLLAPLAVLLGLIGLTRPSRSLAIVGIVTGVIALFVCYSWIKGTQSVGKAMSADTFNNTGDTVDNSAAPILKASVAGVWNDIEENKIAAGKKYGGHRLMFTNEKILDFSGDAANPSLQFVGKDEEYSTKVVSASFSAADGEKISSLKKGGKASFLCDAIGESFMEGYSLTKCALK